MICTTYFLTFFSELIPPTGYTYKFVERVLRNIQAFIEEENPIKKNPEPDNHENIRGAAYYQ